MEVVADLFLGMRMACAKCHHQPSNPKLLDAHAKHFWEVFGKPEAESGCECELSVDANLSKSLHLLNSGDVQNRLQSGHGRAAECSREQDRADAEKIRELYLAAFAREPHAEESALIIEQIPWYANKEQAWEDVIWSILYAREFQFVK